VCLLYLREKEKKENRKRKPDQTPRDRPWVTAVAVVDCCVVGGGGEERDEVFTCIPITNKKCLCDIPNKALALSLLSLSVSLSLSLCMHIKTIHMMSCE
jgi:hypothetical protein